MNTKHPLFKNVTSIKTLSAEDAVVIAKELLYLEESVEHHIASFEDFVKAVSLLSKVPLSSDEALDQVTSILEETPIEGFEDISIEIAESLVTNKDTVITNLHDELSASVEALVTTGKDLMIEQYSDLAERLSKVDNKTIPTYLKQYFQVNSNEELPTIDTTVEFSMDKVKHILEISNEEWAKTLDDIKDNFNIIPEKLDTEQSFEAKSQYIIDKTKAVNNFINSRLAAVTIAETKNIQ